ncbi:MAG: D-alanyl-D-alanine carboxypeptidase/D-alanyl-D-alanine-endopeptidase [Bacteroidales bacterium]|jgi:D-alanyl-D-alanine carboxypeptidase/D-alanyl-D-alanine-endopeptidase (penicillin-binding protein 4)
MKTKLIFFIISVSITLSSFSQNKNDSLSPLNKLKFTIDSLKKDKTLKNEQWSFCVKKIDNDSLICKYKSDTGLIPASTMKVITTIAAIKILGEEFRFKTFLGYDGKINKDSILKGNIFIIGGGDPTLGSCRFGSNDSLVLSHWTEIIKNKGIKKIDGNIIANADFFKDSIIPASWDTADIGNYYGAGCAGLNFNENSYNIYFKSGKYIGDATSIVSVSSEISNIKFINNVKTGNKWSGDNVIIYSHPYSDEIRCEGTIPFGAKKFIVKGSVPDPAYFCAFQLYKTLAANKITISGNATTTRKNKNLKSDNLIIIDTIYSPSLKEIIKETNLKSVNIFAEALLKMCGKIKYNYGSTTKGISAILDYWKSRGVNLNNLIMKDGSGLSASNRVSANQFVEILIAATKEPFFQTFYESLPVVGQSGSIKNICKNSQADGNVRAKSGFMKNVRAYVGYVDTKSKQQLAFSFLVNNYECTPAEMKKKIEKIIMLMAELY